ncbi:MAG: hypothetical protein A3F70_17315 [Acidobacteria bacterium RIFCSPLOWO2_12_FULL_67_14]|nr:MAG: hypothetical protein A3F70_17315 [Acidobacteria bacterium RIFCSPLOWO2_12_FULL_67_14]
MTRRRLQSGERVVDLGSGSGMDTGSGLRRGCAAGGIAADVLGLSGAVQIVAAITFASGLVAAGRMRETLRRAP